MKPTVSRIVPTSLVLLCLFAAAPRTPAAIFPNGELLTYAVTWPSGLSLGEASLRAEATAEGWEFEMTVEAGLPTLEIKDEYRAKSDVSLCSRESSKNAKHGDRKIQERVDFDQQAGEAVRKTINGGESTFPIPPCARDTLTYLYFLREQLAAGRIPPPDDVYFGAQYQISVTYLESRDIDVSGESRPADRILVDVSGPKSQLGFEVFFGKDEARTPLLIRIPFEMGTFSLRLVQ